MKGGFLNRQGTKPDSRATHASVHSTQRQAGTATVPSGLGGAEPPARTAVFTPPDASAHAKYQQLVSTFSEPFKEAGVQAAEEGLWGMWGECCRFENRHSIDAISNMCQALLSKHDKSSTAYALVELFVQRTLIAASIHQPTFHSFISQQAIDVHTAHCMTLLYSIFGGRIRPAKDTGVLKKVPKECLPSESYAVWAPMHWHPRSIEVACRALLSTDDPFVQKQAKFYIQLFKSPPTSSKVDFNAVLQDSNCMTALWGVLQQPDHTMLVLKKILSELMTRVEATRSNLDHLLKMGAAQPLICALNHLSTKCEQQAAQHLQASQQQKLKLLQVQKQLHECTLSSLEDLVGNVHLAALRDRSAKEGLTLGQARAAGSGNDAAWPSDLLEAHLHALIKFLKMKMLSGEPVSSYLKSFTHILHQYPKASYTMVATILTHHNPAILSDLAHFVERTAAAIPTSKRDAAGACSDALYFILHVLLITEGTSTCTDLLRQLPFEHRLGPSTLQAFMHALNEVQHLQQAHEEGSDVYQDLLQCAFSLLARADVGVRHLELPVPAPDNDFLLKLAQELYCNSWWQEAVLVLPEGEKMAQMFSNCFFKKKLEALVFGAASSGVGSDGACAASSGAASSDSERAENLIACVQAGGQSCDAAGSDDLSALAQSLRAHAASANGAVASGAAGSGGRGGGVSAAGNGAASGGAAGGVASGSGGAGAAGRGGGCDAAVSGGGGGGESSKSTSTAVSTAAGAIGSAKTESKSSSSANHGGSGKADRVCASCGRGGKLKACGRCEAVWFCGKDCQKSSWPSHRLVCAPKSAAVP